MRFSLKLGIELSAVFATLCTATSSNSNLKVSTSSGTATGFINSTNPDVRQFLGIPFVQPPVGKLRWLPPKALPESSKHNTIDATKTPLSCPQFYEPTDIDPSLYGLDVPEFEVHDSLSEDCLSLSIWTPEKVTEPLPVIIWIYGGTFVHGGISIEYQQPTQWVQRTKSHIVVAINYRVGIFGFPTARGLNDQNLGLLDQRAGIEWVKENIAKFGGDVNRMVLWGQSAGGASVDIQNFAYYDDPIVSGFISDSGTVWLNLRNDNFTYFDIVAQNFSCYNTNAATQLECMRKVSYVDIEAFLQTWADAGDSPSLTFYPYPDDKVVFTNYTQRYVEGKVSDRPAIFGSNKDDGVPFVTYPDPPNSSPDEAAAEDVDIYYFRCPAAFTSLQRTELNLTTYRYYYEGNFSDISPRWWMGAYHQSEVPMLMGTYGDFRGPASHFQVQTANYLQDQWLAFAKNPHNGPVAKGWKPYSTGYIDVIGETFANGSGIVSYPTPYLNIDAECQDVYIAFIDNDIP